MSMSNYLATPQQIKDLTAITDNVDVKHIAAAMVTANDLRMQSVLGPIFLDALITQVATEIVIVSATNALPVEVTTDGDHGFTTGDSIYIQGATGEAINGQFTITVTSTTAFELNALDGSLLGVYDTGTGTAMRMPAANVAIMPLIRKVYAWWVFKDATPYMVAHVVNAGYMQQNGKSREFGGDGGVQVSPADMKRYINQAETTAEAYQRQLLAFWVCNKADYPQWAPACTLIDSSLERLAYQQGYIHDPYLETGTQPDRKRPANFRIQGV